MEDISNIKCQLRHLYFEEYFIQQKKETIANIYLIIYALTLHLWYIIVVNGIIANIQC